MIERIAELRDRQVVNISDGNVLGFVGDIELDTMIRKLDPDAHAAFEHHHIARKLLTK